MKSRREPSSAPSRAPVISSMAYATVYPATISCSPAPLALRSARMLGMATLTMVASSSAMNCAITRMASIAPSPRSSTASAS